MPPLADDPRWTEFRQAMPIAPRWAYFDHAAVAPLSGPARDAIAAWSDAAAHEGDEPWPEWAERVEAVRARAAGLIGAEPAEVAFVPNTTWGLSLVAEGLDWRPGDNVVLPDDEFPSNQYPWLNLESRGVEVRRVDARPAAGGAGVELARLAEACDGRTRIVSLSWVGYASGWRIDVDAVCELAHSRGALLVLDAIQGLGVFPLDVRRTPVDFLAADGHKWLLGPEGAGVAYIRREHLDRLRPLGVGWNSVRRRYDFHAIDYTLRGVAARYEGGSQNMVGVQALGASLDLLAAAGYGPASNALAERVLAVADLAVDRLTAELGAEWLAPRAGDRRSGIATFRLPGRNPHDLRAACRAAGVALSCRGGGLRIAPHAYNDATDLDRLIAALRAAA